MPNLDSEANTAVEQPDGMIIIAGGFSSVAGTSRHHVARLSGSGSLDTGFNPNLNDFVRGLMLQPDGRVVVAGGFTTAGGFPRPYVIRTTAGGILESAFNPGLDADVYSCALDPEGRIFLGGNFTQAAGSSRVARVSGNGLLDNSFNSDVNDTVRAALLLPDGKLLIAGNFTTVGGTERPRIARLKNDGTADPLFTGSVNGPVYSMAMQGDGRIIIGGAFTSVNGIPRTNLARLETDGALDLSFNISANDIVRSIVVQTDGKILVGGPFTALGTPSRSRFARLTAGGSIDTGFSGIVSGGQVFGVTVLANGRIVLTGPFSSVGGTSRSNIARLLNDVATQSLTVPTPGRIQWLRGGASPEANRVSFEVSEDGGSSWAPIGFGHRIAGGWEFNGRLGTAAGIARARARISGGYGGASTGEVEAKVPFSFSVQQMWRQEHFATPDNAGDASDNADPDNDGLENLVEFAFGLNPKEADPPSLPEWEKEDDDLVLRFSRPSGVDGVTYIAEVSPTLAPDSWIPIANTVTAPEYAFYVPRKQGRLYLRLRVTAP